MLKILTHMIDVGQDFGPHLSIIGWDRECGQSRPPERLRPYGTR